MKRIRYFQVLPAILLIGLPQGEARADGGTIRSREAQGPFIVTIFTTSEPLRDSFTDVSVMVQRRDSSDVILDADVDLRFTAPRTLIMAPIEQVSCCHSGMGLSSRVPESHITNFTLPANRAQASNKLLYAAPVNFGAAGNWRLQAFVKQGSEAANFTCDIPVGLPPRALAGLLPYLVLPPLLVALFAVNQWLRKQPSEKNTI